MSEVEIITGLDQSGKTIFLNTYLNMRKNKNENILIISIGRGNKSIHQVSNIKFKVFDSIFGIDEKKLLYLISISNPQRIFIEGDYVSMRYIDKILLTKPLRERIIITSRINIINAKHIKMILKNNMCKYLGNIIIINNYDGVQLKDEDLYSIRNMNLNSFLFYIEDFNELYTKFKYYKLINNEFYSSIFKYIRI